MPKRTCLAAVLWMALQGTGVLSAQTFPTDDPVIRRIWEEGTERSEAARLAQVLMDSLGPRLTGTPESEASSDWVIATYRSWGIEARREPYGTWRGWRRGVTRIDLLEPRLRVLEGSMLAWSPGTDGAVTGSVVTIPPIVDADGLDAFFEAARGSFVLLSPPEPSCRTEESWMRWGAPGARERMQADRDAVQHAWARRVLATGLSGTELIARLEDTGALGFLTSRWSGGWGTRIVHDAWSEVVPTLDLSCEDYGLLFRLAENGQGPLLRVEADAEWLGEVPVWNTVAVIPGTGKPDEYVVLSAHFDSWDGASGATDNGTGTVTMMEAMRILRATYPAPRRTLVVGHWNGEEQGLNGSRAFVADNPEIVEGLQALFNQDEGTGRVTRISMQGLVRVGEVMRSWLGALPPEITEAIELVDPGSPSLGGSDDAAFICAGAPSFRLSSLSWEYNPYTWHTDRDTFDKVVLEDLRKNAILTAMLAYLASEEPELLPRERIPLPEDPSSGPPGSWPVCRDGARSYR